MTTHDQRGLPDSLAQMRTIVQPFDIRNRKNAEHWTASLYLRSISVYLTWLLLKTSISANAVTGLMILTGWLTATALLIPGIYGAFLAVVLGQLQMLFDCCDGEVARWRNTKSPKGIFLDSVGHYSTEALIALAFGIRAALYPFEAPADFVWTTLGSLLALCIVLNKALNDMARNARTRAGLPNLNDTKHVNAPTGGLLAKAHRLARFLPFHRMFHSVEMTLVVFGFAIVGVLFSLQQIDQILLGTLLIACIVTLGGHFLAIMSSRRFKS